MKYLLFAILLFCSSLRASEIYQYKLPGAENGEVDFKKLKDHTILVVNIATRCGYTGQLDGLENSFRNIKKESLLLLVFHRMILEGRLLRRVKRAAKFCRLKFGVSFPITKKLRVSGNEKHPLIKHLLSSTRTEKVSWNFNKFLINKKGKVIAHFLSSVPPEDKLLAKKIESEI